MFPSEGEGIFLHSIFGVILLSRVLLTCRLIVFTDLSCLKEREEKR
jgi:hypothetical protein